jgi:hypothetical protein
MEMKMSEIIEILEQETDPGIDSPADYQWWRNTFVAGIEHCIDVLSEIRDREGGRMNFEIDQCGPDELVLKVPNQCIETFKLCTEVATESKRDHLEGIYMTWRGSLKEDKT